MTKKKNWEFNLLYFLALSLLIVQGFLLEPEQAWLLFVTIGYGACLTLSQLKGVPNGN